MRVILSARAAWVVTKDADVEGNVRTASMMVKNSWVEIVICCEGGAEVLDATTFVGAVMGAGGPEKTKGSRAACIGARGGDAGTEGARA